MIVCIYYDLSTPLSAGNTFGGLQFYRNVFDGYCFVVNNSEFGHEMENVVSRTQHRNRSFIFELH